MLLLNGVGAASRVDCHVTGSQYLGPIMSCGFVSEEDILGSGEDILCSVKDAVGEDIVFNYE